MFSSYYVPSCSSRLARYFILSQLILVCTSTDTTVRIRCKVVSIGQSAVLVRGELVSEDGKTIYNVMDHNKLNIVLKKASSAHQLANAAKI